jgi:hypothetical protein
MWPREIHEQNAGLKRLLDKTDLVKDAPREVAKGNSEPTEIGPTRAILAKF